ncbi:hypothetical protein BDV09DRAFT_171820 [Aspergillus tetrazonus]
MMMSFLSHNFMNYHLLNLKSASQADPQRERKWTTRLARAPTLSLQTFHLKRTKGRQFQVLQAALLCMLLRRRALLMISCMITRANSQPCRR